MFVTKLSLAIALIVGTAIGATFLRPPARLEESGVNQVTVAGEDDADSATFSRARADAEAAKQKLEGFRDIPVLLLRRKPIEIYRVAPGDTLGIIVDGVLGDSATFIPVGLIETQDGNPSLGYPIVVRDDGTISMPQLKAIKVNGMSIAEIEAALCRAYTVDKNIIKPEKFSATVTLARRRTIKVLVIRQDDGGGTSESKQLLELPFGDDDVLTALAKTGGVPGTVGMHEVIIERSPSNPGVKDENVETSPANAEALPAKKVKKQIRIPIVIRPGDSFPITEEDIILHNGDVVFVPARKD
jgi:protein involved in polysaccharide export with SLBB domain